MPQFGLGSSFDDLFQPLAEEFGRGMPRAAMRGPRGLSTPGLDEEPTGADDPLRILDLDDLLLFAPRGIEGLLRSVGDLASVIPGVETDFSSRRILGRSDTLVGGLAEGAAQFLVPFGAASKALGGLGRIVGGSSRILAANRTAGLTAGAVGRSLLAGGVADGVAFSGHEQRLSNLLIRAPGLNNVVTRYLAAQPGDTEAEGRLKNVLEGMALGALTEPLFAVLGALRKGRQEIAAGATVTEAAKVVDDAMPEGALQAVDEASAKLISDPAPAVELTAEPYKPLAERFSEETDRLASTQATELPPDLEQNVPELRERQKAILERNDARRGKLSKRREKKAKKERERQIASMQEGGAAISPKVARAYNEGGYAKVLEVLGDKTAVGPDAAARAVARTEQSADALAETGHALLSGSVKDQSGKARQAMGLLEEGVNPTHYDQSTTQKLLTRALEAEIDVKAPDVTTERAMLAEANNVVETFFDMDAERRLLWVASTVQEGRDSTKNALAMRAIYQVYSNRAFNLFAKGDRGKALFGALNDLALYRAAVRSVGGSAGRTLRAFQTFVETSQDDIAGSLSDLTRKTNLTKDQLIDKFDQIDTIRRTDGDAAAVALGKWAEQDGFTRGVNMGVGLYIGNLLSGGKTIMSSGLFSAMTSIYDPIEQMAGGLAWGALGKDPNLAEFTRGFDRLVGQFRALGDAARLAGRAWREKSSVISRNAREVSEFATSAFKSEAALMNNQKGMAATTLNAMGSFLGFAPRAMVTLDEFVRQFTARGYIYAESMAKSRANGLDRLSASTKAIDDIESSFINGQILSDRTLRMAAKRRLEEMGHTPESPIWSSLLKNEEASLAKQLSFSEREPVAAAALAKGDEVTALARLPEGSIGRSIQRLPENHPTIRLILPFTKTPINLAKYGTRRTPLDPVLAAGEYAIRRLSGAPKSDILENARLQTTRQMAEGGRAGAEVAGRLVAASGFTTFAVMAVNSGLVTGGGPQDPGQRKSLQAAGWLPYSIRTPDGYVSFQRADPLALALGLAADATELAKFSDPLEVGKIQGALQGVFMSMSRNLVNKTYMSGLRQFIDAISNGGSAASSFAESFGTSLVIPKAVQQFVPITDDPLLHESQGILQALQARTPFLASGVPPVRNVLGEPIRKATAFAPGGEDSPATLWFDIFLPIAYREVKDDVINTEFRELREAFNPPPYRRFGLALTTYENPAGRNAYDRWGELHGSVRVGGKTLSRALRDTIRSRRYQALPIRGEPFQRSPRAAALSSVISTYREAAWDEMIGEFPGLRAEAGASARTRSLLRSGSPSQIAAASRRLERLGR